MPFRSAQMTTKDFSRGYAAGLCFDAARNTKVPKTPRVLSYRASSSSGSLTKSVGSLMARSILVGGVLVMPR